MMKILLLPNGLTMSQLGSSKSTKPERIFRMMLVRRGVKHALHPRIPGYPRRSADLLVGKTFVFIHGRFWHDPSGRSRTMSTYWRNKVASNHQRDLSTRRQLNRLGYSFITIWCDDLTGDRVRASRAVARLATQPSAS